MSFPSNSPLSNENYSIASGSNSTAPFITILMTRDPNTMDIQYAQKTRWINTQTAGEFILLGYNTISGVTTANWLALGFEGTQNTFTPTLSLSVPGSSSFTYATQSGEYTLLSNMVTFSMRIVLSAYTQGSGSGVVQIGTLPFPSGASSTNIILSCSLQNVTFGASVSWYQGLLSPGTNFILFVGMVTASPQSMLAASALSNTSIINVSGTYFIS